MPSLVVKVGPSKGNLQFRPNTREHSRLLACQRQCILSGRTDKPPDRQPVSSNEFPSEVQICSADVGPLESGPQIAQCWLASRFLAVRPSLSPPLLSSPLLLVFKLVFALYAPSPSSIHSENNLDPSSLLSFCPKSVRLRVGFVFRARQNCGGKQRVS